MFLTFLGRIQNYSSLQRLQIQKLKMKNIPRFQSSKKYPLFSSQNDGMYTTYSSQFFKQKLFLLLSRQKQHPHNCGIRFFKVHQANSCCISKTLLDSFERIFSKLIFGLRYHNLAAFFS